jgi:hypothetical protein
MRRGRFFPGLPLSIAAWALALVVGVAAGIQFQTAPGEPGRGAESWPDGTALARAGDRPTLLLFGHPLCPCTRASLAELEKLLSRVEGRVRTTVVWSWDGAERPADEVGLIERARALPGVATFDDVGAREARRFGVATSGEALLFDAEGRRVYRGGLTGSRGHEGDNAGRDAVLARLEGEETAARSAPVFGCPLLDPDGAR